MINFILRYSMVLLFTLPLLSTFVLADTNNGLVAHWTFDDGTAIDASGKANDGTLYGKPTPTIGKVGSGALLFNGTNNYINLGNLGSFGASKSSMFTGVTISLWLKTTSTNVMDIIGNTGSPNSTAEFSLRINENLYGRNSPGSIKFIWYENNGAGYRIVVSGGSKIYDGHWHCLQITIPSITTTNGKVWLDGASLAVSINNNVDSIYQTWSISPYLALGARSLSNGSTDNFFIGSMDDVRIYNRALDVNETDQLYALGGNEDSSGETTTTPSSPSDQDHSPIGSQTTYYVDYGAGSDSNDGISKLTSWKHAPGDTNATDNAGAKVLSAGDVVKFKGGVVYKGGITVSTSGTLDSPIIYDGNSTGDWGTGKAVIDRDYLINSNAIQLNKSVSHIHVQGFELRNAGGYADDDPVVINAANGVYGNSTNAIHVPRSGIGVSMVGLNTDIYLSDLYIHHIGIWHSTLGWDGRSISGTGIYAASPKSLTIKNCELTKIGSAGIRINASLGDVNGVLITDSYLHDNIPQWAMDIAPQRVGATIENVTITKSRFENLWSNWSGTIEDPGGTGTTTPHQNYIFMRQSMSLSYWKNVNIAGNWFGETGNITGLGGTGAIFLSEGPSVNIYNNVFARNWSYTGTIVIGYPVIAGMHQIVRIYNNTFYRGSGSVITLAQKNIPGAKEVYIENNLILNALGLRANNVMLAADQAEPIKALDYNIYWSPDWNASQMYVAIISDLSGYSNLARLRQFGFESNGSYEDPLLYDITNVNMALRDYRVRSNSSAIGKGKNLSEFFTSDYLGNSRPSVGPWTIGAYEYTGLLSGDVSGDGRLTMHDAALAFRYTMGGSLTDTQKQNADINADGKIDGADVVTIARKALGL